MRMDDSWFFDWYNGDATDAERWLCERMEDFDEYFHDMRFKKGTAPYGLIMCKSKSADSEGWMDDEAQLPEELELFSYDFFKVRVEELPDCNGYYNHEEQLLCISPESLGEDSTILHEMLHLHEEVVNELPLYYHDALYWALYQELREKIAGLDDAINNHAHVLNGTQIYEEGGLHDILFLLKSFDLDIRKGYPLGTVFGYGKVDEFKGLGYETNE